MRRHTQATQARVKLMQADGYLILHIEDDNANGIPLVPFTPHSITGRTEALGGRVQVEQREDTTAVVVKIPL